MVRAGLGFDWQCEFANDFDLKKCATYERNWGDNAITPGDIRQITPSDLNHSSDLAWASFPCQDLSLAGGGAGLKGNRSGTFWPFWNLMHQLIDEGNAPSIIALENVCGTLTSHRGKDFKAISKTFRKAGYRFGALVIDAASFVPQSRPRLFMIGVRSDIRVPAPLEVDTPCSSWHTKGLQRAFANLTKPDQTNWIWWNLPNTPPRTSNFVDLIEDDPASVQWHSARDTQKLIDMMSPVNRAKLQTARALGAKAVGCIYKRTRRDSEGNKIQRAEIRFDDIAGCLRTPSGGSSRQLIMVVEGNNVRSRLLSTRETARLMGVSDAYSLPANYNEAYHLMGDGVAVPVVRFLASHIFEPIINANAPAERNAA